MVALPRPLDISLPDVQQPNPQTIGKEFWDYKHNGLLVGMRYHDTDADELVPVFPELNITADATQTERATQKIAQFASYYVILMFWHGSPYIKEPFKNRQISVARRMGYSRIWDGLPAEHLQNLHFATDSLSLRYMETFLKAQQVHAMRYIEMLFASAFRLEHDSLNAVDIPWDDRTKITNLLANLGPKLIELSDLIHVREYEQVLKDTGWAQQQEAEANLSDMAEARAKADIEGADTLRVEPTSAYPNYDGASLLGT